MKRSKIPSIRFLFCLGFILCSVLYSYAQKEIKLSTTPKELAESMINKPSFAENANGENFCWHARVGMNQFIDNYQLTKNTGWLDAGVKYYDFLIGKLETGPDGYKGWIGPYMYDNKYWIDSHVGDAILLNGILDFSVLVLEKKTTRHWVGINPSAGYQSREVAQMVDAYHTGIVFDETDMKRLINTHLDVMWNRDTEKPGFTNSYVAHGPQKPNEKPTGTLWTSLLDFDQKIRDLYKTRFKENSSASPAYLHYENIISKTPPDFKRKYAKGPVKLPPVNFSDSKDLRMAVVIPSVVKKGEKIIIANSAWESDDELEVALYSKNGKDKLASLNKSKNQMNIIEWDGTDPEKKDHYKGGYRIRWILGNGYREYAITIK